MHCVLGFDGGGTKTDCVLMDQSQRILARASSGPSNPSRVTVAVALAALEEAASRVLTAAGVPRQLVVAVCAGLAGTGRAETTRAVAAALAASFPGVPAKVCTDLDLSLAAAGEDPAVVLVAGTGSAAIGRDTLGRVARAGGNGPLLGDEGSAFDVGRKAIRAVLRDLDRTGVNSALGKQILRQLGCSEWSDLPQRVATAADEVFPRIFPVVAAAADVGDKTAQTLLLEAASDLASLVKIVIVRLDLAALAFLLAKSGGTLTRSAFFDARVDELLRQVAPKARIGPLPLALAEAAARLALQEISSGRPAGN